MLVVLSACQTAMMDGSDPMASVAGRLTTTGIPSILAMTHSVLVATTRMLFGKFYQNLAHGSDIAAALDSARIYLDNNPKRYEVQRGLTRQMLKLEDWFLPALFCSGSNAALLTAKPNAKLPPPVANKSNLRRSRRPGSLAAAANCGTSNAGSPSTRRGASRSPALAVRARPSWLWKQAAG